MIVNDIKKVSKLVEKITNAERIAVDTETVSLKDKSLVAFSFALLSCTTRQIETFVIPTAMTYLKNMPIEGQEKLLTAITNKECIYHHSAFDAQVLYLFGQRIRVLPHDTLLISHLLDENKSHKLKDLVERYLGYKMLRYREVCGTGKKQISFADLTDEIVIDKYSGDDAKYTLKLFNKLYPKLKAIPSVYKCYNDIERPLLRVVADMHNCGVPVNKAKVNQISVICKGKRDNYKDKLDYYMQDVNLNSSKQLREYFIGKKFASVVKVSRKTGEASVDSEVLKKYAVKYNEAGWILKYRYYAKILSTFIPALTPSNSKIHPIFHQCGTTSGRFSSSEPNFQNIPLEDTLGIRECIAAPPGMVFVGADYSQMELRLAAHFSGDKTMIDAYKTGKDLHKLTASAVGCTRTQAKTINFGILYGIGVTSLAKLLKVTRQEASTYISNYYKQYPQIGEFMNNSRKEAHEKGYLELWGGRHRNISSNFNEKTHWEQGGELRSMTNAIIQGSGANILKKAMILLYEALKVYGAHIIATIHDEAIVMCKEEDAEEIKSIVEYCLLKPTENLSVPFKVDCKIGKNWGEIHG